MVLSERSASKLSDFQPTQRFGLLVVAGCIIDILANLFELPLLGGARLKSAFEDASAMHILRPMQAAFYQSDSEQPHPGRSRAIIKAHPEIRQLMVRNPWTALIAASIVVMQTAIAFGMGKLGFG
jgi:predicted RND superfamily exporter protein